MATPKNKHAQGQERKGDGVTPPKQPAKKAAAPAPATAVSPAAAAATAAAAQSAHAAVTSWLSTYGLGDIGPAAYQRYLETGSVDVVYQEIRAGAAWTNGAYAKQFAGIQPGMSEDAYVQHKQAIAESMHAYGIPTSFYDEPSDFAALIAGNVSPKELDDRLNMASQIVATDPRAQQMRDQLARLYGMNNADGLTIAYWIDPAKGEDIIKRQFMAGEAAASSARAGFGSLTQQQAEMVGASGTADADTAFAKLATMGQFQTALTGQAGQDSVSQDELLAAQFGGDGAAQQKVAKIARTRQAAFEGGGNYASGQGGVSGLGSASS